MAKKVIKKAQAGAEVSPRQKAEAKRDSLYKAAKAKSDSTYKAMMNDMPKVQAPKGKDTTRVGSVRITVASKKMGGAFDKYKSKKKN